MRSDVALAEEVLSSQLVGGHHRSLDAVAQEAPEIPGRPEPGGVSLGQEQIAEHHQGVGNASVERIDQLLRVTVDDPSSTRPADPGELVERMLEAPVGSLGLGNVFLDPAVVFPGDDARSLPSCLRERLLPAAPGSPPPERAG